jgi:hypothetical protein
MNVHREYLSSRGVSIVTVKRKGGKLVETPRARAERKTQILHGA